MQKNIIRLLPGVIIIIGIILRLWRLPEVFHFTYDEEVFAFIGKRMFVNGHIPLIGGVTPMHVHLAPYFYWLSGIFLWFSKLNPLGWGYAAVLISCITMILLFVTTQKIYGRTVAIIALFIYCISFYQNVFDRHYWGLVFDGLISVGVMFSIFNIINLKTKYVYLLSLLLAFGINTDPSMIVLILLSIISLFYFKPKINFKIYLIALFIFLFSFLPLVIFDLRHNFYHLKTLWQYSLDTFSGKSDAGFVYYHFLGFWPVFIIIGSFILFFVYKKNRYLSYLLVLIYLIFNLSSSLVNFNSPTGMPGKLTINDILAVSRTISEKATNDFNVVTLYDFDTRGYTLRYFTKYVFNKNPMGEIEYPTSKEIFALAKSDYDFNNNNPWELNVFKPYNIDKLANIGEGFSLFKLTRKN